MSLIEVQNEMTQEKLLRLTENSNFELVGGKLVEKQMGLESSEIAVLIAAILVGFVKPRRLGRIFDSEAGYKCFPGGDVRKPDVSFIRMSRLAGEKAPKGFCDIPPDLAVEVVSPHDEVEELQEKIALYQAVGVHLVWVVYPRTRIVEVYRQSSSPLGSMSHLTASDTITGEDVIPGFSCKVSEFFE